ncbi:hypothetical protein NGA_2005520, partial [Nannochloropsis gaditana CCMP526]
GRRMQISLFQITSLMAVVAVHPVAAFVSSKPAFNFRSRSFYGIVNRQEITTPFRANLVGPVNPSPCRVRLKAEEASKEPEGDGGRRRKVIRKKRVRKDRSQEGGAASEAGEASPPMDPRLKQAQEDIMRREFDRELVLEEFATPRVKDRVRIPTPSAVVADRQLEKGEREGNGRYEAKQDRQKEQNERSDTLDAAINSGVPENLRYDPTLELPIPSETVVSLSDLATKFDAAIETKGTALPTLAELGKKAKVSILRRQLEEEEKATKELEPIDDYDLSSAILGEGRPVLGIGLPYLQSCHTVIILVSLLCAFIEFPGFPLTNFPYELRDFLKQGLVAVYLINAVLAWDSIKEARKRDQSVFFWALKCFVLGALAHNELLLIREKPQNVA